MTGMNKRVRRKTVLRYRVTVTSAAPDPTGREIVAELAGSDHGDMLRLREAGRRTWVELSIPDLYRKGLLAQARARRRG